MDIMTSLFLLLNILQTNQCPASKAEAASALLLTSEIELVAKKDALADLVRNRSRAGHGSCVSSGELTRTDFTMGGQVTTTNTQERKRKAED